MPKKPPTTASEDVYEGLHRVVGRRKISGFIENLARPHLIDEDVAKAYAEMAADEAREAEALE